MILPKKEISPSDVALHYDEIDRFYRELWGLHLHHGLFETGKESPEVAVESLIRLVEQHAGIEPRNRICDVGCGYGGTARFLADRWDAEVIGFTLSRRQYEFARQARNQRGRCRFHLEDWLESRLDPEQFDAVIAIESTEHMADKLGCCRQALRVLKPGGTFVLCAWTANPEASQKAEEKILEPICREGRLPGMATEREYRHWLAEAGFEKIDSDDISSRVSPTWTICIRRVLRRLAFDPASWLYLLNRNNRNRVFLKTVFRMRQGYRDGCLQYHLFTAQKGKPKRRAC